MIFRFRKYVKIRYENFHCSVIVDNLKKDCVLLEKLQKLQRVVHVLCELCALGFKKGGKVQKLEQYITERSIPVWILTSRHTEYEKGISVQAGGTFRQGCIAEIYSSSITGSDIHSRMLATIPIEMLRDDSAGSDNARCLYVCGNWPVPVARVWTI